LKTNKQFKTTTTTIIGNAVYFYDAKIRQVIANIWNYSMHAAAFLYHVDALPNTYCQMQHHTNWRCKQAKPNRKKL
jgi:hypothetical protein